MNRGRPLVGFYVHHHGLGHLVRTAAILGHMDSEAAVLTSADASRVDLRGAEVVRLPLDTDAPEEVHAPPLRGLHYAPVGSRGLRERTALIAAWAAERRPSLLVVDVSAEVSVLGRLLALPVVTVRQHGRRTDAPHLAAYGVSRALLAPYPETLEEPDVPRWMAGRTFYTGGFSRYDRLIRHGRHPEPTPISGPRRRVSVLLGAGGSALEHRTVARAAAASRGWDWTVLGGLRGASPRSRPPNLTHLPWVDDVFAHLLASDVVVASGSHNSVMEVAAARRPLVCIPQERPFGEQESKAERLAAVGAAVVRRRWPRAVEWPGVLRRASLLRPAALAGIVDGGGGARAAAFLDDLARAHAEARPTERVAPSRTSARA